MRDFTAATGVALAPHGKTTMCPQIFARQLDDGAWGITVANVQQLGLCVDVGIRRVIMANQLVSRGDVAQVIALQRAHADLEFHFLVDSPAQLARIEAEAARHAMARPLTALLELGVAGGRTGVRHRDDALVLARAIRRSTAVSLVGLECYEGLTIRGEAQADAEYVGGLMRTMREVAGAIDAEGLFEASPIVLSAGGSAVFDIVARELHATLSKPALTILRSGCYVSHDSGTYERMLANVRERTGGAWKTRPGPRHALEVWAQVQSRPEPALAILTMGKRDVSFDVEMPRPLAWHRDGAHAAPQPVPSSWRITRLNDQHAYLELPADDDLAVGDLVGSGISHPCTTFDKWALIAEVDDGYTVVGGLRTFF
jgi:D-serine dehydratase